MTEIRKLQLEELNMLTEFVSLCEKNKLRYFILGGTLLGAVRHGGFIPWDDDVDIAMPRWDYEAFIKLASRELSGSYYIDNYNINPRFRYVFSRMSDKNMQVYNYSAIKPRKEDVSIDIIPLDGFPDKGPKRNIHKLRLSFWWILNQLIQYDYLVDQKRKRSILGKLFVKIAGAFKWIGCFIDYHTCFKHIDNILKEYPYDSETTDIINFAAAIGFEEIFPRKCFGEGRLYDFENMKVVGPENFDSICKIIYGDYMVLPPEEERNKHNTEIITNE